MKVWIAVHHFPPHYTGGAEWRAFRTAKALQQRGHKVQVICVERIDLGAEQELRWYDEEYQGIPVRRLEFNLSSAEDPFRWSYDNPWIGMAMRHWLAQERPDLFHLISGYLITVSPLRVALDAAIPTIVTLTDFWFLCPRINLLRSDGKISSLPVRVENCARCLGEEKRRFRWLGKLFPHTMALYWRGQYRRTAQLQQRLTFLLMTLNEVDQIISPSQFLRSVYVQSGVRPEKIIFLRQGISLNNLPKDLKPIESQRIRLGYIGQIALHKGVHLLVEALRKNLDLDVELKIYGDTTHYPAYARQISRMAKRDPRISIKGVYRGTQELSRVMAELDAIVVPSVWYENSPNVILEAFAHKVPVVASNLGGMAELVQHGKNGFLFRTGDVNSLAEQIRRLVQEPDILLRLRGGIEPVKDVEQEMDELLEIYAEVISNRQKVGS